jgi:hypothetical protein
MPTIGEAYRRKQALVSGQLWQTLLGETDERWAYRVTCETTRTRINDNQDLRGALG